MKHARRTFESGLLALLMLPWMRHSPLGEWLALGVPISVAIGTVIQQELVQWTRWFGDMATRHGF